MSKRRFGPSGALIYKAVDAVSNTTLVSYTASGAMGGTNMMSLKVVRRRLLACRTAKSLIQL